MIVPCTLRIKRSANEIDVEVLSVGTDVHSSICIRTLFGADVNKRPKPVLRYALKGKRLHLGDVHPLQRTLRSLFAAAQVLYISPPFC